MMRSLMFTSTWLIATSAALAQAVSLSRQVLQLQHPSAEIHGDARRSPGSLSELWQICARTTQGPLIDVVAEW